MNWMVSISIATVCYASHILAIRFLGEKFPSSFITPVFYFFGLCLLGVLFFIDRPKLNLEEVTTPTILIILTIAGFSIALTDFFFVKSLNLGAEASTIMPMLVGGSAVLVAVLGAVVFKEAVSVTKITGIIFAVLGIFLIHRG
jgi:drug/metabolite transporter (DMT)-like permease